MTDFAPALEGVLTFWFEEIEPEMWWKKDKDLDEYIIHTFAKIHRHARVGALYSWRNTAEGRLAEIIMLDQFSRNMYRDSADAFLQDPLAVALCQEGIRQQCDVKLSETQRAFFYMPLMHSEHPAIHELALKQFTELGNEQNLKFEILHKNIIDQFGRYPHRNAILGRESTAKEIAFLNDPNSPRF